MPEEIPHPIITLSNVIGRLAENQPHESAELSEVLAYLTKLYLVAQCVVKRNIEPCSVFAPDECNKCDLTKMVGLAPSPEGSLRCQCKQCPKYYYVHERYSYGDDAQLCPDCIKAKKKDAIPESDEIDPVITALSKKITAYIDTVFEPLKVADAYISKTGGIAQQIATAVETLSKQVANDLDKGSATIDRALEDAEDAENADLPCKNCLKYFKPYKNIVTGNNEIEYCPNCLYPESWTQNKDSAPTDGAK